MALSEAKSITKRLSLNRWQKRWNTATTGRFTNDLFPKTRENSYKTVGIRASEIKLNRLRSGTSLLKDHMHKIMPNVYSSPLCECGMGIQTISHILLDCTLHAIPREHLFDSIETVFKQCNVSVHNRYYNLQVLLGKPEYLQVDVCNRIHHLVAKFLTATGIKI